MKEEKYSVIANRVSKCYKMYASPKEKFLDLVLPSGAGKDFYALKDISFKVKKGDVVGLIGLNGSGKSTLSNILGGVSMPTKGNIDIEGEASLIAIGIGLNNFLSGIENIEIKSIMMGYKKEEIEKIKQEIIDFADIGDFINQPIRTYSSGMRSRLGFAISVYTNPDILVIDEALSVGDPTFTQKCLDKMNEFKDNGKTIFFVSHSLSQIKQFCNKAMWLEYGALREYGDVEEILPKYEEYISFINSLDNEDKKKHKRRVLRSQEHALLSEFKVINNKFKKLEFRGKLVKHVALINRVGSTKYVAYNFDYLTAAFSFIPSLIRKRYLEGIVLLAIQSINFFIIPYPASIIGYLITNLTASLVTGRIYTQDLVEKKHYVDYEMWKKNMNALNINEDKAKKCKINLVKKIKLGRIYFGISLIVILGVIGFVII